MSKKRVLMGIFAVMILAIFFRFWDIKTIPPGLYPDEAMNGNNALEALENKDWKIFYPENNGREGLFINIQAASLAVFGNEPWALRIVSAIFGTLTVLGLYFLTKALFKSERIALLASFFMATSFWHINFSRIGFRAIMAPFFLVWSFYFLWKVIGVISQGISQRLNLCKTKVKPLFFSAISGLLFGLGFHSYIAYRIAPLLLIIPFILLWKAGQKKLILIFLIFVFSASLPLGLYFLKNPQDLFGRTSQISIFSMASPLKELGANIVKTIGMFFWAGDYNWRHNLAGAPQLWWPVAILFLTGVIIGIWKLIKRASHRMKIVGVGAQNFREAKILGISDFQTMTGELLFIFAWFATMLLPTVISSEGLPHALRAIVIIPPVMIFIALGFDRLISKMKLWLENKTLQFPQSLKQLLRIKREFVALLFVFLLAVASHAFNQYFFRWTGSPYVADAFSKNYAELGRYLNNLPSDIPKYVIINTDGVDVNGIPMPSQTTMFITKTYLPKWQIEKNIFYVPVKNFDSFIKEAKRKKRLYVTLLENDNSLRSKLGEIIPELKISAESGIIILYK